MNGEQKKQVVRGTTGILKALISGLANNQRQETQKREAQKKNCGACNGAK